jgi:hypothetical protein
MSIIKIIDDLDIKSFRNQNSPLLPFKIKGKKEYQIHMQQGDIDGACGPYSILMALIIKGCVKITDDEKKVDKALKSFGANPLIRKGTVVNELNKFIDIINGKFSLRKIQGKDDKLFQKIISYLNTDEPVMIGLPGHWSLAIGYEAWDPQVISIDDKDASFKIVNVDRLYLLDPSIRSPNGTYWNAVLTRKAKYRGKTYYYDDIFGNIRIHNDRILTAYYLEEK